MPGSLLGNAVRRVEDPGLLRGSSAYVDDLKIDGLAHLIFVRSPYAHARIVNIDAAAAKEMPGVVGVYTHEEMAGQTAMAVFGSLNDVCVRPILASDRVRFVGEAVAVVAAESVTAALDAAEAVLVDYEPLGTVTGLDEAMAADAPLQFEAMGTNVAAGKREPSKRDPFEDADVIVRGRFENQRVAVAPIEPSAVVVLPSPEGEFDLTVYVTTQMPHMVRDRVADTFDLEQAKVRVIAPAVGGGFGGKIGVGIETSVAVEVARLLNRPVKWVESRSENLVNMNGRSQVQYAEMGFRRNGEIVGARLRTAGDCGAYAGFGGALALGPSRNMAQGPYHIPRISFEGAAVMTNTSPNGAFRGAGRPEICALLERIMDIGADELEIDPAELRRKNFIRPEEFPYTTLMGMNYDCGEYARALDEALRLADYDKMLDEQAERRRAGARWQLGIGIGSYVEITGAGAGEFGSVAIDTEGMATVRVGTSAHGQGHATTFSMIVSDRLGIPMEKIRFIQSDTAEVPRGHGTGGSRSLQKGGSAVNNAAELVLEEARKLAGELFEADVADIVLDDESRFHVAGVPSNSVGWQELATVAADRGSALSAEYDFNPAGPTFPFGSHVSIVEVDMETGYVRPIRHIAVDDAGRVVNPLIVGGQQHGGIATGIAQALWEEVRYDEQGNPLNGNLATYCIPSAADLISYDIANTETPTPLNPLGAKGIGESASIGSTPAVQNAVVDALSPLGVRHVDMPCTPERVWNAIRDARNGILHDPWREPPAAFSALPAVGGDEEQEEDIDI